MAFDQVAEAWIVEAQKAWGDLVYPRMDPPASSAKDEYLQLKERLWLPWDYYQKPAEVRAASAAFSFFGSQVLAFYIPMYCYAVLQDESEADVCCGSISQFVSSKSQLALSRMFTGYQILVLHTYFFLRSSSDGLLDQERECLELARSVLLDGGQQRKALTGLN